MDFLIELLNRSLGWIDEKCTLSGLMDLERRTRERSIWLVGTRESNSTIGLQKAVIHDNPEKKLSLHHQQGNRPF